MQTNLDLKLSDVQVRKHFACNLQVQVQAIQRHHPYKDLETRKSATYLHNFSIWHHFAAWIAASDVEVTLVELPEATAVHGRVVAAVHTGYVETLR